MDWRNVHPITVVASPWLDSIAALYYWCAFIAAESWRYQERTGKRFPRYQDRQPPILIKPWKTHYLGISAGVFTWALAAVHYHMHGAALGWTVVLLLVFMFFALGNGPLEQVVPTIEGVFQMAVAVNLVLYLTVHHWAPGWLTLMSIMVGIILGTEWVYALKLAIQLARRQPRHPTNNRND
jgi:hypothetical protein